MKKLTLNIIKKSVKEIGLKGTIIRGNDFFASHLSENERLYQLVKKKFKYSMSREALEVCNNEKRENTIWVCWFQGIENAPEIVKCCYDSLVEYNKKANIVVITDENYKQYVNLPDYVIEKYESGVITRTHFSDILRAALLYQNGGLWVDSTMLFTGEIPDYVWNGEMFVFKIFNPETRQVASSQFIYAKQNNEILGRTLLGLYEYWKKHNGLITYYLFHYFFAVAVESTEVCKKIWSEVPNYYSELNHLLQRELFCEYSDLKWGYFKKVSFVHKLSYKHITNEREELVNTFYKHIIKNKSLYN